MRFGIALGRVLMVSLGVGVLTLPYVGGVLLAYLSMLLSALLILWWLGSRPRLAELRDAGGIMTLVAFGLIATAFACTARNPADMRFSFNFILLALFPLLRAAAARHAAPRNSILVGLMALTGVAIAAIVALAQSQFGAVRSSGFGSDPIWAAQVALVIGFTALVGFDALRSRWRYGFLLGPPLALLVVVLSQSRGPLLVVPALVICAGIFAHRHRWVALVIGAAGIAVIAVVMALPSIVPGLPTRLATFHDDQSLATRALLYRGGVAAFVDSPWVGYGWDRRVDADYAHVPGGRDAIETDASMIGNRHLHADLLEFGVGAGALGLLAYLLTILAPLVSTLGSKRDSQYPGRLRAAALLSTVFLGCGLSYVMLGYELPTTLFVCIGAIITGFCADAPSAISIAAQSPSSFGKRPDGTVSLSIGAERAP